MKKWGEYSVPLVTVRCLTYNHEKYISQALDGFLMQETDFPFEILIHDDASPDGTADIIRDYEKKYPNIIKAFYQTENQHSQKNGVIGRLLREYTRGKYIATCEGDDCWASPVKLQSQISYMEAHPECALCFHAVNYVRDGEIVKNDQITDKECDISTEQIIEGGGLFCATASCCYKTKDRSHHTNYRRMADVGDYPLQVMLATLGTVHYFPDVWGVYRIDVPGSWSQRVRSNETQIKHWHTEIAWLDEFNKETEYKYNDSVLTRTNYYYMTLYRLGEKGAVKEAQRRIKQLSNREKMKRLRWRNIKSIIIIKFPLVSKVKAKLNNALRG